MNHTRAQQRAETFTTQLVEQARRRDPALALALDQAARGPAPQDPPWLSPTARCSEAANSQAARSIQWAFNQASAGMEPPDRARDSHQAARLLALPARRHTETFWDTGEQDPRAPELRPRVALAMRLLPLTRALSCNATCQRRFFTWRLARSLRQDNTDDTHLALDQLSDLRYGLDIPTILSGPESQRPDGPSPTSRQDARPLSPAETGREQRRNAAAGAACINLLWSRSPSLTVALDRATGWGNSLNQPWLHQPRNPAADILFQAFSDLASQLAPRQQHHLALDLAEALTHQTYSACDALQSPEEAHPDTLPGLRHPQEPDPHPDSRKEILEMLNHHHITNLFQATQDVHQALLDRSPRAFQKALLQAGDQVTAMQANSLSLHLPQEFRQGIEDIIEPLLAERDQALSQAAREPQDNATRQHPRDRTRPGPPA